MQDLIKKLNAIDIGKLFSGKSGATDAGAGAQTSGTSIMDELLFRMDKKLAVIVASALFLIFVGLSSMFRTIEAFNAVSDLEMKVGLLKAEKLKIETEMVSTKKANKELFLLANNAVSNQEELLRVLTDAYSNAGMSIIKVVTGTADKPDLIQINAEGSYRAVQHLLSELRLFSPSIDVKLLQIGTDPTKDMLQMSLGLRFVKAPKFSKNSHSEQESYAYMDGSKTPSSFARAMFKTVQFVPQVPVAQSAPPVNPVASSAVAQSASTKAQSTKDLALERNPFYIPPSQSTGAPGVVEAERKGCAVVSPALLLVAETVPSGVSTSQSEEAERISRSVFCTPLFSPQNGQVPVTREESGVMSMSPFPPFQIFGSLAGSFPENENVHSCDSRSTVTYLSPPGQLESYTFTLATFSEGHSTA